MPRSIWNGMISFGLVNIPVGLYPATRDNTLHFHLLHKKDCGRIRQQRVCEECGEVVDYDELVNHTEATARGILDFCGLSFETDTLAVGRPGSVATASSAYVRTEPTCA